MPKLTKKAFEDHFREVLPYVIERYGVSDKPARRQAWNDTVDSYIRDGILAEAAGNWAHPRWLETWLPSGGRSHATKKKSLARYWKVVRTDLINGGETLVAANFSTKADAEEAALDHLAASKSTRYLFKPKAQGTRPIKGPHDTY